MAHSKGDDNRDKREVEQYWAKDPISKFVSQHPEEARHIQDEVTQRIDAALAALEADERPAQPRPVKTRLFFRRVRWKPTVLESDERVVALLYSCFQRNLKANDRIVMIGEDIEGPYGGAFKVTKTLSQEFPGRVRNTPISEAAIVGLGQWTGARRYVAGSRNHVRRLPHPGCRPDHQSRGEIPFHVQRSGHSSVSH